MGANFGGQNGTIIRRIAGQPGVEVIIPVLSFVFIRVIRGQLQGSGLDGIQRQESAE